MLHTIYQAGCDAFDGTLSVGSRFCGALSTVSWATSLAEARKELEQAGWSFTSRGKIGNSHRGWNAWCPDHTQDREG